MQSRHRTPIRVVLVEDDDLFRDLLRHALGTFATIQVLGGFADAETALEEIPGLDPDVVVMDIELGGGMNGIQLGLVLRGQLPGLGVVILSNHADPEFIASLPAEVMPGWSYLLKRSVSDAATIGRAIEGAARRLIVLDPALIGAIRPPTTGPLAHLTRRQQQILGLLAQGFTNAAIAERLQLAEKSVENQTNLLYQNLGIDRAHRSIHPRVQAVLLYIEASRGQRSLSRPRA